MSRSYKHSPVLNNAEHVSSEKQDKKQAHKALRTHFRSTLKATPDLDAVTFDEHNYAHSERETFSKGGKLRADLKIHVSSETGHVHVKKTNSISKDIRQVHKKIAK